MLRLFWLESVVYELADDGKGLDLVWVNVLLEKGFLFLDFGKVLVDLSEIWY